MFEHDEDVEEKARQLVKHYGESADDFGMTLQEYLEATNWPKDYVFANYILKITEFLKAYPGDKK